jgi:hypothetical protein
MSREHRKELSIMKTQYSRRSLIAGGALAFVGTTLAGRTSNIAALKMPLGHLK